MTTTKLTDYDRVVELLNKQGSVTNRGIMTALMINSPHQHTARLVEHGLANKERAMSGRGKGFTIYIKNKKIKD